MSDDVLAVRVECDAGHRGEETPRRFWLGGRFVTVTEIKDGGKEDGKTRQSSDGARTCSRRNRASTSSPGRKPQVTQALRGGPVKHWRVFVIGLVCFVLGAAVQAGLAQKKESRKPTFSLDVFKGDAKAVATAMLDGALQLAANGSWERIAVGRAWYLGGDRAKGQQIFDAAASAKHVARSDWVRLGRAYVEAGEWDKAQAAFDKAYPADSSDDTGLVEYGAFANLNGDRAKAEALFARALKKNPDHFWHWVNAGGSYLGVRPR